MTRLVWPRCRHPRTPANTVKPNRSKRTCRTCYDRRRAVFRAPANPIIAEAIPAAPCEQMTPIQLYQFEKAKRAEKRQPAMEAARQAFEAQLAIERATRTGGRPRGSKNGCRQDVSDLMRR